MNPLTPLRSMFTRLLSVAVLAGCLLAGVAGSTLAPRASAAEAGVNLNGLAPANGAQATALGAHWVRVFATWPDIEPSRGVHNAAWVSTYERLFASLPKGTHVIVAFVDTPTWENGSTAPHAPPSDPADYANVLHYIAGQWKGHVAGYEIWNEEDASLWWPSGPDPAAYTRLLQAAYPAVKSADPAAKVVLGGMTGNDFHFLQEVYATGARGYFDALGVHLDTACNTNSPFTFIRDNNFQIYQDSFIAYRELHATEVAHGDNKPIWVTELSWRTTSAECSEGAFAGKKRAGVSEAQQGKYLSEAYHCLASAPYVQVALWFPVNDGGNGDAGLLRGNHSRKPSYTAMRKFIKHGDRMKGGCGNFSGPKLTVTTPTRSERYTRHLLIRVKAVDGEGIERVRLEYDGHLIRNYDPHVLTGRYPHALNATMLWLGADRLKLGHHVVTILAYNKARNVSRRNIAIVRLPEASKHH